MPTKWFLLMALAVIMVSGAIAFRTPVRDAGPAPRPPRNPLSPRPVASESPSFVPAGTPQSGRFRFVDLTGQTAPDFRLQDLEGRWHTLNEHRGKVVMLVFWATACKTCPIELPHVGAIAHALAPKGLVTFSINWEKDAGPVARMARETRLGVPVLRDLDQKTRYEYDSWTVPRVVIVDRGGKISRIIRGYEGEAGPIVKALADQGLPLPGFEATVRPIPVERVPLAGSSRQ